MIRFLLLFLCGFCVVTATDRMDCIAEVLSFCVAHCATNPSMDPTRCSRVMCPALMHYKCPSRDFRDPKHGESQGIFGILGLVFGLIGTLGVGGIVLDRAINPVFGSIYDPSVMLEEGFGGPLTSNRSNYSQVAKTVFVSGNFNATVGALVPPYTASLSLPVVPSTPLGPDDVNGAAFVFIETGNEAILVGSGIVIPSGAGNMATIVFGTIEGPSGMPPAAGTPLLIRYVFAYKPY